MPLTSTEQHNLLVYRSGRLHGLTQKEAWAMVARYPAQQPDASVQTCWDHLSFQEAIAAVEASFQSGPYYVPELDRTILPPPPPRYGPEDGFEDDFEDDLDDDLEDTPQLPRRPLA